MRASLLFCAVLCVGCGGEIVEADGSGGSGSATHANGEGAADNPSNPSNPASCPDLPDCNWCKGQPRFENGCHVGWTCANGADACTTDPCAVPEMCSAGNICLPDGLCWPGPSGCGDKSCSSTANECGCSWTCTDQRTYRSDCQALSTGEVVCTCSINGDTFDWVCIVEEGNGDACGMGPACCVFPD